VKLKGSFCDLRQTIGEIDPSSLCHPHPRTSQMEKNVFTFFVKMSFHRFGLYEKNRKKGEILNGF
jgi:hypothetical protein